MMLVPFESTFKALLNGTKTIEIREILNTLTEILYNFFSFYAILEIIYIVSVAHIKTRFIFLVILQTDIVYRIFTDFVNLVKFKDCMKIIQNTLKGRMLKNNYV